jgi:hypothetical protein
MIRALLLVVVLSLPLSAQFNWASPVYRGPDGRTDKWLTAGLVNIYGGSAFDATTTRLALADGAAERNPFLRPLYGRAPGVAETAKFSVNAVSVWGTKRLMDSCASRKCRIAVRIYAGCQAGFFYWLGFHNLGVATECRRGCR